MQLITHQLHIDQLPLSPIKDHRPSFDIIELTEDSFAFFL